MPRGMFVKTEEDQSSFSVYITIAMSDSSKNQIAHANFFSCHCHEQ
jgi:hypothetical protein